VAWGVVHLPRPWLRRAVAIVLLAASLAGLARLYTDPALLKADWRGALGYVDEHAIASDRVLLRQLERVVLLRFYDCELPWAILGSSPTYRDWTASTASGGRSWLLYRHPGESAHTPTKPWPFDIYSEADAATVAWLTTHREAVVEHHSLAGIELLLLEVEP
jgi:hypothetical protein